MESYSLLVGRSANCDIQVELGHPSREHARAIERDGGVQVEDLHSTNGTFINNNQVHGATLAKVGDILKFSDETFSVQLKDNAGTTMVMSPINLGAQGAGSMIIDEDEDEDDDTDATSLLQVFPLPVGWSDFDSTEPTTAVGAQESKRRQAIDKFTAQFARSLKGIPGMALIFFVEENLPVVRTLHTSHKQKNWHFGRGSDNGIILDKPCVSKRHGVFTFEQGRWSYTDDGSTNGLWLGNRRLDDTDLIDGMRLKISSLELLVRIIN